MSQEVKLNYPVEIQDHIHSQVQFQKSTNCPCGYQNFDFGQGQMGVIKLNIGFQNNMILGSDR